jgi:RNA polymerase sigma-70 factor (ECF subfamily)
MRTAARGSVATDTELIARCRNGDHAAWRMLHDRHAPTVYRFLSALGVPPAEREDACQDVFVAVYRSLDSFRGAARLSTWIYRIAARGAGRAMRRRRMPVMLATLLQREPAAPPDPDPSEKSARLALLDGMLGRLSEKKRLVLVLFEIEELPVDEIAKIAGCPENTVWSRLHHARTELAAMARKSVGKTAGKTAGGMS